MVTIVNTADIDRVWDRAVPLLSKAFNGADPEVVKDFLKKGTYQLWVAGDFDAAATTAINVFPVGSVLTVVHCGGSKLWEWMNEGIHEIEDWARQHGCGRVRIQGRAEWSRVLPGYAKQAVVSEKVIS